MIPYRWTVACINWTTPDAPHAVVYLKRGRVGEHYQYFRSHAEAIAYADRQARRFPVLWGVGR